MHTIRLLACLVVEEELLCVRHGVLSLPLGNAQLDRPYSQTRTWFHWETDPHALPDSGVL